MHGEPSPALTITAPEQGSCCTLTLVAQVSRIFQLDQETRRKPLGYSNKLNFLSVNHLSTGAWRK